MYSRGIYLQNFIVKYLLKKVKFAKVVELFALLYKEHGSVLSNYSKVLIEVAFFLTIPFLVVTNERFLSKLKLIKTLREERIQVFHYIET